MSGMDTSVFLYPWDILDEGMDDVLDRLQSHQINGLTISTTYHSGMFLMPHNPKRKLIFPLPGALYFEPDPQWYGKIRIKPPISPLASNEFWDRLRQETAQRGMSLTSWTITLHGSHIGTQYPDTNVINVFGDANPTIPCVAHDDVRQYIVAFIADLAENHRFDNILLESLECMPLRHGYHHEVIGIPLTPAVEFLLSLSFSEAMVDKARAAGVDIDKVREFVRNTCEAHFASPHTGINKSWRELHQAADGEFGKFLAFRQSLLTSLMKDISQVVKGKSKLSVIDFGPVWYPMGADGTGWESGLDLRNYAPYIDEVHPTFYFHDTDLLRKKMHAYDQMLASIGKKLPLKPILRPILPQTETKEQLVEQIRELKACSQGLSFYNYSFMSYDTLDWIEEGLNA
jgi:hypothetical protein